MPWTCSLEGLFVKLPHTLLLKNFFVGQGFQSAPCKSRPIEVLCLKATGWRPLRGEAAFTHTIVAGILQGECVCLVIESHSQLPPAYL